MKESEPPCCSHCGGCQIRKWVCEGCSLGQQLKGRQGSQNLDTINLDWPSGNKQTPVTHLDQSSLQKQGSPGSFAEYLESRHDDQQKLQTDRKLNVKEIQYMFCRHHDEPLSFYNKNTKEILCSCCLFQKGLLSQNSKLKGQGLMPLKSSIDIIKVQLKELMIEMTKVSSNLEAGIKICRRSAQSIRNHETLLSDSIREMGEVMIEQIRLKEKQSRANIQVVLDTLMEGYALKESRFRQMLSNSKELKFLASKSRQLRSDELAYLFESAKELKTLYWDSQIQVVPFDHFTYTLPSFNRRNFKLQLDQIFDCQQSAHPLLSAHSSRGAVKGKDSRAPKESILKHRDKSYMQLRK